MKLCQLEFRTWDAEASLRFVEAVLGWKQVPVSIQDQIIIEVPDDSPYGISLRKVQKQKNAADPLGPVAYFECEVPLQALRETILALGARVLSEPAPVVGYGQVMIAEDQGGLRIGLYEAKFLAPKRTER